MPLSHADRILPGESFGPSDSLISPDGRFRIDWETLTTPFTEIYPVIRGYTVDAGIIKDFLFQPGMKFPGSSVTLGIDFVVGGGFIPQPALVARSTGGQVVWHYLRPIQFPYPATKLLYLILQNDGNVVFYVDTGSGTDFVWASDSARHFTGNRAVPPNAAVANITNGVGTLILQPNGGNTDFVNNSGTLAAVRDDQQVVSLLPNQTVSANVASPGTVQIVTYDWPNLLDGDGTQAADKNGDAIGVKPPKLGRRNQIYLGPGGSLTLGDTGSHFMLGALNGPENIKLGD